MTRLSTQWASVAVSYWVEALNAQLHDAFGAQPGTVKFVTRRTPSYQTLRPPLPPGAPGSAAT